MEDTEIIDLYFQRNESAIAETDRKYGAFCRRVALNVLSVAADAEECVSDAYLQAWNSIPPQRPEKLGAWLGRVVRNRAINLWQKNHRRKRYAGMEELLDELADCIPSPDTVERQLEERELSSLIRQWLLSLPQNDRILFVRRYWYGQALNELALEAGVTPGRLAKRMYRLRQVLRQTLEREGFSI